MFFMNNRIFSILLGSYEEPEGFIGHGYGVSLITVIAGPMTVIVRLILISKRSSLRTSPSRFSKPTMACLSGNTAIQ